MMSLIKESIDAIMWHYKQGTLKIVHSIAGIIMTAMGLFGAYLVPQCKWQTLVLTFLLYSWTMFGVIGGAHRLWSHRSFKASYPVRLFLGVGFVMANMNSISEWVMKHRAHHKYSDEDGDPYDTSRGFFFGRWF